MSDVELSVSDELEEWSVTGFGLVDFRAISGFPFFYLGGHSDDGVLFKLPEIGAVSGDGG
jgi:hypothetical protein